MVSPSVTLNSKVIVNHATDVERCAWLHFTYSTHELVGLFGTPCVALFIHVELKGGFKRVLQRLLKLINGANPILYVLSVQFAGLCLDVGHKLFLPLLGSTFVEKSVFVYEFEHAAGEYLIHQNVDALFPDFRFNLHAIIIEVTIALCERVFCQTPSSSRRKAECR